MITISSNNSFRRILAVVLAVGVFAALPALASAQTIDPTSDQYHNVLQQVSRAVRRLDPAAELLEQRQLDDERLHAP